MKVKQYREDTMQKAMARVRAELGKDAVLISSRKIDGQVLVLAGCDYDSKKLEDRLEKRLDEKLQGLKPSATIVKKQPEKDFHFELLADKEKEEPDQSAALQDMQDELGKLRKLFEGELAQLVWRDARDRQPNRMALLSRMEMVGINHDLSAKLVDRVLPCDDLERGWQQVIRTLVKVIKSPAPDPLKEGGVIAMVGSTGVGKTTSAVKIAARFSQQHGRNQVALITTDDFRVGQREQLITLAGSLGLSVQVAANREEMQKALECFADRKLVIIDTAGVNQRNRGMQKKYAYLWEGEKKVSPYLVLSATVQESVTNETIRSFSTLKPAAAIITKTDENLSIGPVLSSLIRYRLPVSFVGTGQGIPDDFDYATREFFIGMVNESYQYSAAQMQRQRKAAG